MTETDTPITADQIRNEYMRSLSDAYAGGPAVREQTWARLLHQIERYAAQRAATEQPPPILTPDTATAQAVAPDTTDKPKPQAKPTARKATTT